ncbi:MAG: PEP/pyruvate-binding domain-containing protein [Thermoanaerobaculia bacterium]
MRQQLQIRRFHDLMPFRVREVLLVSSPFDAFILEEDGQLSEQVFFEYRDVSLSGPPRVTHVPTGELALQRLQEHRYDLILVMTSLADMGANALGREIKKLRPGRPVVLLALDRKELDLARSTIDPESIDGVFLWSGDSKILLAIIKYFEDRENVDHDILHGNVRVILLVEDSPTYYSSLFGTLYKELMRQSHSLYSEGVNELHRRMYMRSRPKILHAKTYDEGQALFHRYQDNIIALVSDVEIPRDGKLDKAGGLDLVRVVRSFDPQLPVLLESAEEANQSKAEAVDATFVHKGSGSLLADVSNFFRQELGFGDFIFRTEAEGEEVARAHDVREFERQLAVVPEECLFYHASHNHFSVWLMARSEFDLAESLRPRRISDFENVEALRQYLIANLRETRRRSYRGVIADFSRKTFDRDAICRIGQGSIGGKARGLAFLNLTLSKNSEDALGGMNVSVPRTTVITTDKFDEFVDRNHLRDFAYKCDDDRELCARFLSARLSDELHSDLTFIAHHLDGPLAIRSSSLLEDSMHQPMAGIYSTLMIPNRSRDPEERLREICSAVKLVYASTYFRNAKSYLNSTGNRVEEEKMAVIIQRLVGQKYDNRFYPHFGGVAQSHNFYPIGNQRAEEGIVHVALGLGRLVVDGGLALRFSPRRPGILPQHATPKLILDSSQRDFYAVDLDSTCCEIDVTLSTNVKSFPLRVAELDGTLLPVGSVFSADDQTVRDDLSLPGPRLVTFNNILKHGAIPLAPALLNLLELAEQGLGCPVEIEFACDMGDWGRPAARGRSRAKPILYLLQVRPSATRTAGKEVQKYSFTTAETLCKSSRSLGHGVEDTVRDLIYVRRDRWTAASNKKIAAEVGELNKKLTEAGQSYLLVGPGRWGTADFWLGIPVQWSQISNVRAIVEASPSGYDVEPSQGTHFFQNIVSLRVGYLTLPAGAEVPDDEADFFDWEWLDSQLAATETDHLRHLHFEQPLTIVLDGREGRGLIAKPKSQP